MKFFLPKTAFCALFIAAALVPAAAAPSFSGLLDSKLTGALGDGRNFTFGIEEYLNLRMQAKIGAIAQVYGAFNFTAFAGQHALFAVPAPAKGDAGFVVGDNFASSIELERLYLQLAGDAFMLNAGLLRQAFGYGSVWSPADFLNPRNPLITDARPRAVLAVVGSYFPGDTSKIIAFAAAPKEPDNAGGQGVLGGLSAEKHWSIASIQGLYAYEVGKGGGLHRAGLSFKADVYAGLYADALWIFNPDDAASLDGLSAAAGFDYSFGTREPKPFFQALVVQAEYLYSGAESQTAAGRGGLYSKRHYLSAGVVYRATNYTAFTLSCLAGLEDGSVVPIAVFDQTLSQGLSFTMTAQFFPVLSGEFGREGKTAASLSVKLQARF
ncbi:MAG: hypothetical protein LBG74_02335 [Spirochaetaceae bacterium]|jgi:hypothetical protein|nr:hypothetical protein [Spirochaetaceae bacterium]